MQGIFHPGYRPVHQEAALLLDMPYLAVMKGEGGEIELNPDIDCLVQSVIKGEMIDEEWPAVFKRRHMRDDVLDLSRLIKVWHGEDDDEYGIASIIGTAAIALKMMQRAKTQEEAVAVATSMWESRHKDKFGVAA
jgi:anthranilate phosphoribosyltransferase